MKNILRLSALVAALSLITGCMTESKKSQSEAVDEQIAQMPPVIIPRSEDVELEARLSGLQTQLGLSPDVTELGFAEKSFDSCRFSIRDNESGCGPRYFSVVHFRLLCRDTNETTQEVSASLTPLVADDVQWRLAGVIGHVKTDARGQAQVHLVTPRSTKGQRFILILGSKSLGVEAGEVTQIVVPQNWCTGS